jgi:hypothetical protein
MSDSSIDIRDRQRERPSRSFGDVFGDLSNELHRLVRTELQGAKEELRASAPRTGRANVLLTAMTLAGVLCVLFVSIAAAIGLGEVIPIGFAFLAVGAVYGAGAFFLHRRRQAELAPPLEPVDGNNF